jgi:hypothetical protein
VVYITANTNIATAIRAAATAIELAEHPAGRLRLLRLDHVIAQTHAAAVDAQLASRTVGRSDAGA